MPSATVAKKASSSIFDVYADHREQKIARAIEAQKAQIIGMQGAAAAASVASMEDDVRRMFPPELTRRYEIHIIPSSTAKPTPLRQVKAGLVGSFVSVRGIVTRVTDVAPQVKVVAYLCETCAYESYQPVTDKDFTPLTACPSPVCAKNDVKGKLTLQARGSKFVRYQSVRLQELHTEVPVGHIPRSTTIRVYGTLTRTMKPGDLVTVSGVFLVSPYRGFRAIKAGLTTDTYIHATHVASSKKSYALAVAETDEKTLTDIEDASKDPRVFENLAASIAPEIYGHADIKKALMLLLVVRFTLAHRNRCGTLHPSALIDSACLVTACLLVSLTGRRHT